MQALASLPSAAAGQIRGLLKGVVLKKNGITKLLARTTDHDADTYGQRSWRLASHRSLSPEIRDDQSTYLSLHRPPEAVSAVEGTRLNPEHDKDTTNDPETVANSTEDTSTAYDSTACAFIDILNAHRSRKHHWNQRLVI